MSRGIQNAFTRLTVPWVLAAVILLCTTLGAGPAHARTQQCEGGGREPARATLQELRASMQCLINRVRAHYGIPPLRHSGELRRSATGHSNDMVRHGYFSHYGSRGSVLAVRVARAGYLARANTYSVGENIGGGKGRRFGSPIVVFRTWMHSPSHRANVLSTAFRDFGVGVTRGYPYGGGRKAATYTLNLGFRY